MVDSMLAFRLSYPQTSFKGSSQPGSCREMQFVSSRCDSPSGCIGPYCLIGKGHGKTLVPVRN